MTAIGDAGKRSQLEALTGPPPVARPTVMLLGGCVTVMLVNDILAIDAVIPLWIACLVNALGAYLLFSVIHDSMHRAISTDAGLNDLCGLIATQAMSPGTSLDLFRWGHMQHHRYTNGEGDPDIWLHGGNPWTLPLRWCVIDFYYFIFALHSNDRIAQRYLPAAWIGMGCVGSAVIVLLLVGYWQELFMLWFLPTRILSLTLGFTFFWLPHVPHDTTAQEDPYRATTIRRGWEWLLTPVLQYHNYHLIHHLYPRTPFYNNLKVWRLLEPELRRHTLAVQHGFAIQPVLEQPADS